MICRINKERFNDFMSSLAVREVDAPINIEGYKVQFITIKFDGASFVGGNGIWKELMNIAFRTNQVRENKEVKELV